MVVWSGAVTGSGLVVGAGVIVGSGVVAGDEVAVGTGVVVVAGLSNRMDTVLPFHAVALHDVLKKLHHPVLKYVILWQSTLSSHAT